jgi:hypothetical protein
MTTAIRQSFLAIGFSPDFWITMIALRLLWGSTMSDDSNAELGIAITQFKAAQSKLEHAKGFERSHNWTISQLDERIFGMFTMLVLVILISVWAFDVPALIRYAVTIAAGSIFVFCKSMETKRKNDLDTLRQQQVKEHSQNI